MATEELTLDEMAEKVETLTASLTDLNKKFEASAKKAEEKPEDKPAPTETHIANADSDYAAAIMQAALEQDPEKRMASIKSAMEKHEAKDEKMAGLEKKLEAQENIIKSQEKELAAPKVEYLASAYKQTGIAEEKLAEMKTAWEASSVEELNAEVDKIKPFLNISGTTPAISSNNNGTPVAPPTLFQASTPDPRAKKIDEMSGSDLFGGIQ